MAGMKRFVTYIYSYEEKKKGKNTGYAKIEIRGNEGRMEIHLRGVYPARMKCNVCFFAWEAGDIVGIPIGEMRLQNGAGDFFTVFQVENTGGRQVNFYNLEGIVLISEEQQFFLSRWTEGEPIEVCASHFRLWDNPAEKQKRMPAQLFVSAGTEQGKEMTGSGAEQRKEVTGSGTSQGKEMTGSGASQGKETTGSAETVSVAETGKETETISATELPVRNIFPHYNWNVIWENLKAHHEHFILYRKEEICCVKIELKDIRELPGRYWYLGNNSFLLHGFFNYHYLVVGKVGEERWFIGVPGIYQKQERVMAAIFGFQEFLPEQVENHFGYWCHMIEG